MSFIYLVIISHRPEGVSKVCLVSGSELDSGINLIKDFLHHNSGNELFRPIVVRRVGHFAQIYMSVCMYTCKYSRIHISLFIVILYTFFM